MSSWRGWLSQPPQTASGAALVALAVGVAVFTCHALARGGEYLFAAAVAGPCAALAFVLHLWGPRSRSAHAAGPKAAPYPPSVPPPAKPD